MYSVYWVTKLTYNREVTHYGRAKSRCEYIYTGREGNYAHTQNTVPENYPRLTHITCVWFHSPTVQITDNVFGTESKVPPIRSVQLGLLLAFP